jgi:hypothetical protein
MPAYKLLRAGCRSVRHNFKGYPVMVLYSQSDPRNTSKCQQLRVSKPFRSVNSCIDNMDTDLSTVVVVLP